MQRIIAVFFISLSVTVSMLLFYHMYNKYVVMKKFDAIIEHLKKIEHERKCN